MSTDPEKLMFQPFSSVLNPGFWHQLTKVKLNELKLNQGPIPILGSYVCSLSDTLPCLASFDHSSFDTTGDHPSNWSTSTLYGKLICTNQLKEFLDLDKKKFLDDLGHSIWQSIINYDAVVEPDKHLSRFGLLVYADLKKYKFYYWFAFPALQYPRLINKLSTRPIEELFNVESRSTIYTRIVEKEREKSFCSSYFIIKQTFREGSPQVDISIYPLRSYESLLNPSVAGEQNKLYFAFCDPSADVNHPGWPLRNLLCLIAVRFYLKNVSVVRIRRVKGSTDLSGSSVMDIQLELDESYDINKPESLKNVPVCSGWERNESQHMGPKRIDLSKLLDSKRLAEDAVNLNLRLMKWRLMPSLNLERIANTKCLILGCGTLGCHVARGLLAWGVKNISLLDNSQVSYSNPVRQSLYTFEDCSNQGGAFKAVAAAESLKRIHPTVVVNPIVMSIPMPGHQVTKKEMKQTEEDVHRLEQLIEEHDAVFLLMDTRESRWLPSVIGLSKQKLIINAAIGFDTFLLQRYGVRNYSQVEKTCVTESTSKSIRTHFLAADQLGCYFCNDIVAPGDSTLDRTLDQQCTVSRPGVSMMVSAMAVELLASVLDSKFGADTPAPYDVAPDSIQTEEHDRYYSDLGIVPHSIRGNISRFHIYMPTSPAFNKCSACSQSVIQAYQESGFEFLARVFNDSSYLEEVAGLKDLQNVCDNVWELDSSDEDYSKVAED